MSMNETLVGFKCLVLFSLLAILAACGSNKTVVTKDDSAEYRTARSLPPLKKPGQPQTTNTAAISAPESSADMPGNTAPVVAVSNPSSRQGGTGETVASANEAGRSIRAFVIEPETDVVRLQIDAGFESAWNYVSTSLRGSDITVHNRNQAAGRIAIGCVDVDSGSAITKSGGWAIFKKKSKLREYCALKLVSNKVSTTVSVLNRSGAEISAPSARAVFERLLKS